MLLGALTLAVSAPVTHAQIVVSDAQASESAGAVTFTITRSAPLLAGAATIAFATGDGSATAPADYGATSGSRTFPAALLGGIQVHHVTVAIANDTLDEPDETLRLAISGAGVTDGEGIAVIADDDPPPAVSVLDAAPAAEGSNAVFTVALDRPSGRNVTVAFATANGSATAGQDYTARGGTLTIPAGSTAVPIGVPLIDDNADEPNETFELRLSSPGGASLGDATATATIVDDDAPPSAPAPSQPATAPPGSGAGLPATGSGGAATGSGSGTTATSRPMLGVSSPRLRLPSTILLTLACPRDAGRCRGRVTIFTRPYRRSKIRALRVERRLARRSFGLVGGTSRTLEMKLSRRDRVLLRRAGRISVRAYVVTTDSAGRTGVRRVNGTLIGRTRHSSG